MIPKLLADIQDTDLLSLRDNQVPEGKTIEYKRDLPGSSDTEKREFLKDVSAFANTTGGDLLYGVDAVDGVPRDFPGIGNVNEDELRLRLESLCRDGLDPRLPKIDFRVTPVHGNRVLLIRIPESWTSPHRVKLAGHGHFYARGGAGTFAMDVAELRSAFTSSENIAVKIRNFRMERLAILHNYDTPTPIFRGCRLVLHVIPLSAFASGDRIDISQDHRRMQEILPFATDRPQLWKINLDGVLNYTSANNDGRSRAYAQVFRNGIIESVAVFEPGDDEVKRIHSTKIEAYLIRSLPRYLDILQALQVAAPIFIFLLLVGATDYQFIVPDGPGGVYGHETATTDRYSVVLPEVVMTDYGTNVSRMLKPAFDTLWNAFGYPGSRNFDAAGNWVGR